MSQRRIKGRPVGHLRATSSFLRTVREKLFSFSLRLFDIVARHLLHPKAVYALEIIAVLAIVWLLLTMHTPSPFFAERPVMGDGS